MLIKILSIAIGAFAFDTVPQQTGDFSDVIYPSQNLSMSEKNSSSADGYIELTVGCYGTNLRSVGNPIAPNSQITAQFALAKSTLNINFPGTLATPNGTGSATVSGVPGATVAVAGNKIIVRLPNAVRQTEIRTVDIKDDGDVNETIDVVERDAMVFKSSSFSQTGVSGGQYYARTGKITNVAFRHKVSNDGVKIQGDVRFPGQNGFCGGYFSPVMAFFDDKRPTFENVSDFPLHQLSSKTYWPEANSAGYLVALDRDGNGKIDKANELFGSTDGEKNGFEALKRLDLNGDLKLDKNDPAFAKMILWNDKNGNGKSEKNEMISFADKKLTSLSLEYHREIISYGKRAEEREQSHFTYINAEGKETKAALIDVWFAPFHEQTTIATNE